MQSDLSLRSLSKHFCQATCVRNFRTFTVIPIKLSSHPSLLFPDNSTMKYNHECPCNFCIYLLLINKAQSIFLCTQFVKQDSVLLSNLSLGLSMHTFQHVSVILSILSLIWAIAICSCTNACISGSALPFPAAEERLLLSKLILQIYEGLSHWMNGVSYKYALQEKCHSWKIHIYDWYWHNMSHRMRFPTMWYVWLA